MADTVHHEDQCQAAHDALLSEIRYHVHPELAQLADQVIGPVLYGDVRDTTEGLSGKLSAMTIRLADMEAKLSNGLKVKLPWQFYGSLAIAASTVLAALLTR